MRISLLGELEVFDDAGAAVVITGAKQRILLAALALTPGRVVPTDVLAEAIWGEDPPPAVRNGLQGLVSKLRRGLGATDVVVMRSGGYVLDVPADAVDAVRFEQLARKAISENDPRLAREALDWYGGELLPADLYEDWAADRRESLHLRQLDVLRLIGEWRELSELDPTNEEAHVELMQRHLEAGDGAAALRQYEHLERVLDRELGVTPGAAAREARAAAANLDDRIETLLAELARLETRQTELLAELAAAGAPRSSSPCDV